MDTSTKLNTHTSVNWMKYYLDNRSNISMCLNTIYLWIHNLYQSMFQVSKYSLIIALIVRHCRWFIELLQESTLKDTMWILKCLSNDVLHLVNWMHFSTTEQKVDIIFDMYIYILFNNITLKIKVHRYFSHCEWQRLRNPFYW